MLMQLKNPRLYVMALAEAAIFTMAIFGAYLLRFEFVLKTHEIERIGLILTWLVPLKLAVFFTFGLYKGMWRYSSLHDFWRLAQATLSSSLLAVVIVLFLYRFSDFSRAVFLLDAILTFVMTGAFRVLIRTWYGFTCGSSAYHAIGLPWLTKKNDLKKIFIIGAGDSGEKILREIFDNPGIAYEVAGFLDDDPSKKGRALHGVPVLGPVDGLPQLLDKFNVDQVFISAPSATGPEMRRIVDICKGCSISFKTLPGIGQIMDDKVSIKALRDVNYEDLLRRLPVHLDNTGIEEYLTGKKVMVTGAGGSIGSELCRQLIRFDPERLILVDAGEAYLYDIQMELRHELSFDACHAVLARVQNQGIMEEVFKSYHPDVVFHAAAYKHVPILERNPWEAIFNNVLGSRVVTGLAEKYETKRLVLVSTDKAVRPTNVMGASKRIAELILQSMQNGFTQFMAVRFGNVIASSGSVIPLFLKQIANGGPVTVTHPEVTRYFMTITEAAQLILQAGALGRGGEIFVLEMGTPVKIAEMATDLIRLAGKEPGRDIKIVYTGLRPGEKIYEELITRGEDVTRTRHNKIMVLQHNGRWDWNGSGSQERFRVWLDGELEELSRIADTFDACAIKKKLSELVREYTAQETECVL
ncbi:MAG: nucleoside-diphosphate sugar epimerase/dehydratase [Syntrophobacteraceae bacterium]